MNARLASIAQRVRSWPKVFVPTPIVSAGCCWPRAFREAEELRGDGDARAAAIYAAAYGQDQEFYAFHRSLQAYRESFSSKEDVLVLDPKSDFFRYLQSNK